MNLNKLDPATDQFNPWIGRLIGAPPRYRLDKRLGGGGMGDVFLAMDTRLGQLVALKLLKESLATAGDIRKRFERECAICAALKSQHIVQVSDYGLTPEGYPFYVMEYLHGQTLGQLLTLKKQLSVAQTIRIITQVCAGLQLAHEGVVFWSEDATANERIKVIHCDLKPDNIFLVPTALGELVKIIDFGVAKIRNLQTEQTNATNEFYGTYHYAAPEQIELVSNLDERADIYSLGMILYEMLTGSDPFGFDFTKNKVVATAWANAHASKLPQPLWVQQGCEHLSQELEAVVMRCLQKSPKERFSSVEDLSQALQVADRFGVSASLHSPTPSLPPTIATDATETQENVGSATHINAPIVGTGASKSKWRNNFFPFRKSSWLLIGGGIVLVAAGIYYLQQLSKPPIFQEVKPIVKTPEFALVKTLSGHLDSVWSVVLSSNGQTLVSGSEDKTIKVWNLDTGQLSRTLYGHADAVRSVTLSSDEQTLASGSGDKTIKLWNLQTGVQIRTLSGHSGPVWSVAISRDGQTLVSGSEDNTIKIWNLQTGKLHRILLGHSRPVFSIAISPDGQTFATGSVDKTIKIWNLQTGEVIRTLLGHSDSIRSVVFSPDGQKLASGSWDKTIKVWNLRTGEAIHTLEGHRDRVVSVAFSSDGQIASASIDKTIKIWALQTGKLLRTLSEHSDWVLSVAASPTRLTLVSSSKDKTLKIWRR